MIPSTATKTDAPAERLRLVSNDEGLLPYESAIQGRYDYAVRREQELTEGQSLVDWANGYQYFGLHTNTKLWFVREWAPNATAIYLVGDMNGWQKSEDYRLMPVGNGVWEGKWKRSMLRHGQYYKLLIEWQGGSGYRIPAYAFRVVQDDQTKLFAAQVWSPKPYEWINPRPGDLKKDNLYIYECHIGMSGEGGSVASYEQFRQEVLPRVADLGYNCLQIMAIQEHPYYGSFGYHVSNFFAASSRFGTPEELKALIDDAHGRGIAVIMDIVHSHAVKNEVLHFLLSNCKYWLDEYRFDGFRFDGVTSMMYLSHGLGEDFTSYASYYNGNEDGDAICYLTLANRLIHDFLPEAVTIAEDMSGMPGLAAPVRDGGMGFDYRLAMGIPDFWIKYIKEVRDEDWKAGHIFYEMTNRRQDEKSISYAESHDQALVGDKTIIFRLVDSDMYWHFEHGHDTYRVNRGIALHKMIRLVTASTARGGYLNFMGNEFGHPEWIDFPREGNGWSYHYAHRQWSLVDNENYYYADLNRFDRDMIHLLSGVEGKPLIDRPAEVLWDKEGDQVHAFRRGDLVFVFNWNGQRSFFDYGILAPEGKYEVLLNTDSPRYAGFGLADDTVEHFTQPDPLYAADRKGWLKLYLPARSAVVLKKV